MVTGAPFGSVAQLIPFIKNPNTSLNSESMNRLYSSEAKTNSTAIESLFGVKLNSRTVESSVVKSVLLFKFARMFRSSLPVVPIFEEVF